MLGTYVTPSLQASQASIATHKKVVTLCKASKIAEAKLKEERQSSAKLKSELEGLGRKMADLSLEKEGVEGRIKASEDKAASAERDATTAEERAKAAEDRAKDALGRAKAAEDKIVQLQAAQADMLAEANDNGYRRGEQEAGKQYLKEAEDMEARAFDKGYRLGHKDCFPVAYLRGVDACNAPPEAEARIVPPTPEPQVPEMPMDDLEDVEDGAEDDHSEAPGV